MTMLPRPYSVKNSEHMSSLSCYGMQYTFFACVHTPPYYKTKTMAALEVHAQTARPARNRFYRIVNQYEIEWYVMYPDDTNLSPTLAPNVWYNALTNNALATNQHWQSHTTGAGESGSQFLHTLSSNDTLHVWRIQTRRGNVPIDNTYKDSEVKIRAGIHWSKLRWMRGAGIGVASQNAAEN